MVILILEFDDDALYFTLTSKALSKAQILKHHLVILAHAFSIWRQINPIISWLIEMTFVYKMKKKNKSLGTGKVELFVLIFLVLLIKMKS